MSINITHWFFFNKYKSSLYRITVNVIKVKENRKQKINRFDDRVIIVVSIKKLNTRRRIGELLVSTPDLTFFF